MVEPVRALSIWPKRLGEGGTLQVVEHRPDGSVEHLLWIDGFIPNHRRSYEFRRTPVLPAGTRILLKPDGVTASLQVAITKVTIDSLSQLG